MDIFNSNNCHPNDDLPVKDNGSYENIIKNSDDVNNNLLKEELKIAKEMIEQLKERLFILNKRLTDQAKLMLSKGIKFENICSLNKPSVIIKRYAELYEQYRVDALDEIDAIISRDGLSCKILYTVFVVSFNSVNQTIRKLKIDAKNIIKPYTPLFSDEFSDYLVNFLQKSLDNIDYSCNSKEVLSKIIETLSEYSELESCERFKLFIDQCVSLSWALLTSSSLFKVYYSGEVFENDKHERHHTSNMNNEIINGYIWPALILENSCVYKAIVIT